MGVTVFGYANQLAQIEAIAAVIDVDVAAQPSSAVRRRVPAEVKRRPSESSHSVQYEVTGL